MSYLTFLNGDKSTLSKVKEASPSDISVSSIAFFEINFGLCCSQVLAKKISLMVNDFFSSIKILPFCENEARIATDLRANLKKWDAYWRI